MAVSMVFGGAINGLLVGQVGVLCRALPSGVRQPVLVAVCVGAFLLDLVGARVPTGHWLVPRQWTRWSWPAYPMIFGTILGIGWLTVVPFASYYLMIALLLIIGDSTLAVVTMTAFGIARTVPVLLLSREIFAPTPGLDNAGRAVFRRKILHSIAGSRMMWVLRTAASIAAVVLAWGRS
ncbi:MAG TPA: hypothetical protein VN700_09415 [Vicinamibacterales bacterium]|nr:hypothetical protein [Vicinamibacterales bacterium]